MMARDSRLSPDSGVRCMLLKKTRDYIFLVKPPRVHSVALDFSETNSVANWLLSVDPGLARVDPLECGLAHRLDFETSGVMVAARKTEAHRYLRGLFTSGGIKKIYAALTDHEPPGPGIYTAIAGKHSKSAKRIALVPEGAVKTRAKPRQPQRVMTEIIKASREKSGLWRVVIHLVTGYRHQIRAHLAALGCPILGDGVYRGTPAERLMLHARELAFAGDDGEKFRATAVEPF